MDTNYKHLLQEAFLSCHLSKIPKSPGVTSVLALAVLSCLACLVVCFLATL